MVRALMGRVAGLAGIGAGLLACAPDLTLGTLPATGGGGTGGTGAGGTGAGTSTTGSGAGGGSDGGEVEWAITVAGSGDEIPRALLRTPSGEIIVAVEITGSIDVDNLSSAGATDIATVRFGTTGMPVAATGLGGLSPQSVKALAPDSGGATLVTGDFSGSISGGAKQANSNGGLDGYVAQLDGQDLVTWIRGFGGPGHDTCAGVLVNTAGQLTVAGTFTGSLESGPASAGGEDVFVTRLAFDGTPLWTKAFGDAAAQRARALGAAPDDHVVLLAEIAGTPILDGSPLTTAGGTDLLVAELDDTGTLVWAKVFGTAGDDLAGELAVDPAGNIIFTGTFAGAYDFGGGAVPGQGFVAKLDPTGSHLASRGFISKETLSLEDVALDETGNILIAGAFSGELDVGPTTLASAGAEDVFVVKLAPDGGLSWARSFGGQEAEHATAVTTGESGAVMVTGFFAGSAMLGGEALGPSQGEDLFLMRLTP